MGYNEALEDGVRISKNEAKTFYHPECKICGREMITESYVRKNNYICKSCKQENRELKKNEKMMKKERQLANSLRILKKQLHKMRKNIADYEDAIEKVKNKIQLFDSKEETLVAIVLEYHGLRYEAQKEILTYKVDFSLSEYKILLEIDGELYHNYFNQEKDRVRDEDILTYLGEEWIVVRLSARTIDVNSLCLKELFDELAYTEYKRNICNNYDGMYFEIYTIRENQALDERLI